MAEPTGSPPRVVIIGGGFGGLETARRLRKADVRLTLIDRHNYHLFQPLLYQVATGGLSPANIATPLRYILRRQTNAEVLLAEVTDFDPVNRRVVLTDGEIEFDVLVVAAGSTHSYFGRDDWQPRAPGLKSIRDAIEMRSRIYLAFEAAERETDPNVRQGLMTFVVVGGGPTGVELAGALSEIASHTLRHDFRHIDPQDARILIVEAAGHVLAHYPESLCQRVSEKLQAFGIEVHTHTKVTEITDNHVRLHSPEGETVLPTRTILWAAGVQANPLGKKLAAACNVETDRAGRIPVTSELNVDGYENIFVVGDLALCIDETSGKPLPGLAPVAMQQGACVAERIAARVSGQSVPEPFRYIDRGTMATIGRAAAVAQVGRHQFCGRFAWLLWLSIHLLQIVQFQNRLLVLMQWIWNYFTFNRSSRIITGDEHVDVVRHPSLPSFETSRREQGDGESEKLPGR
ncbi:MAG: NAD(P)/FAD-dependent oxidoreductase [Planctomycetota bacterium]|jgi:NADH dehydrogenase